METSPPPSLWSELVGAIAYRDASHLPLIIAGLAATSLLIWFLKGRWWAYIYVALIPFLNWTFGKNVPQADLTTLLGGVFGSAQPILFNPLTIATGMVFVVRDFVQREMGHRVLILMALAIAWSFYYSLPSIAIASATAFAISEGVDWLLFTFTKYRLSTRILLSSALAAPIDTTVFLYGADLGSRLAAEASGVPFVPLLTPANWIFFVIGKMIGAVIVSYMIRRREERGTVDPAAA
jgi:hypothetical protein